MLGLAPGPVPSARATLTLTVFLGEGAPPVSSWKAGPTPRFCSSALGTPACLAGGRVRAGIPEADDAVGRSCGVAPRSGGRRADTQQHPGRRRGERGLGRPEEGAAGALAGPGRQVALGPAGPGGQRGPARRARGRRAPRLPGWPLLAARVLLAACPPRPRRHAAGDQGRLRRQPTPTRLETPNTTARTGRAPPVTYVRPRGWRHQTRPPEPAVPPVTTAF